MSTTKDYAEAMRTIREAEVMFRNIHAMSLTWAEQEKDLAHRTTDEKEKGYRAVTEKRARKVGWWALKGITIVKEILGK
jgi:hypothetical protein